jgi:hypothetical protein
MYCKRMRGCHLYVRLLKGITRLASYCYATSSNESVVLM